MLEISNLRGGGGFGWISSTCPSSFVRIVAIGSELCPSQKKCSQENAFSSIISPEITFLWALSLGGCNSEPIDQILWVWSSSMLRKIMFHTLLNLYLWKWLPVIAPLHAVQDLSLYCFGKHLGWTEKVCLEMYQFKLYMVVHFSSWSFCQLICHKLCKILHEL